MRARLRIVGTTLPVSSWERKLAESPVRRPKFDKAHGTPEAHGADSLADLLVVDLLLDAGGIDDRGITYSGGHINEIGVRERLTLADVCTIL